MDGESNHADQPGQPDQFNLTNLTSSTWPTWLAATALIYNKKTRRYVPPLLFADYTSFMKLYKGIL